ncbi:MAG: hydrogenase [Deltaproteobacteria bacterium]|nr:hydrogenase [Deltaproteobacteria bacterium]
MNWILIGIILTAFFLLGSARLAGAIRLAAVQGALLAAIPWLEGEMSNWHRIPLAIVIFVIKAIAIPVLLHRSIREAAVRQEAEPGVSLHVSLLTGGLILVIAFSSARVLPLPATILSPLTIPVAFATFLIGFLILITRTQAVSQIIGFLVLENGIFLFGSTLLTDFPLTVELGVLLDLLVGVFVMGIMIYHIHRTFDHINTKALSTLKDTE